MKRLLATASVVVAVFTGTSLIGAEAANNGVGPSDSGSTGKARACEVHAQNKGKSHARGLECASTSTTTPSTTTPSTTSTTVVAGPSLTGILTQTESGCFLDAVGSGLQPGSATYIESRPIGEVRVRGTVSETGDFSFSGLLPGVFSTQCADYAEEGSIKGTAASGAEIRTAVVYEP